MQKKYDAIRNVRGLEAIEKMIKMLSNTAGLGKPR
jgi:hypothetical protein